MIRLVQNLLSTTKCMQFNDYDQNHATINSKSISLASADRTFKVLGHNLPDMRSYNNLKHN
ncbi:hypothetical protein X798_03404 [Onchocerca flexuosa]|uniref:Uncharacterized protein n=1 Tax=Onchocerca flexuosa TaxID=387005 RepID=A0A238BXU0_9BILA|nr:hypothetical protein X798_03404 [Onchocerca flexuosa]